LESTRKARRIDRKPPDQRNTGQSFPPGSNLPGERELAVQFGVTRPTLREVLQRLERDGWIEIRQGKPTRVRDYWQEGNLAVLVAVALIKGELPLTLSPTCCMCAFC
jgi:GntR family transcriptional regulator, negative regulator for fad regulon and positive regulator of fabA